MKDPSVMCNYVSVGILYVVDILHSSIISIHRNLGNDDLYCTTSTACFSAFTIHSQCVKIPRMTVATCLHLWRNAWRVGVNQTNALGHVFVSRLCHSGRTHAFRRCSVAAMGAFEYPKTNSINGNKEELYFVLIAAS